VVIVGDKGRGNRREGVNESRGVKEGERGND
jgi:hypothetical protein